MKNIFRIFSQKTLEIVGSPGSFIAAILILFIWMAVGPLFHFSSSWAALINTITSTITFLMVILIQYTQNRDTKALNLKLDELIRSMEGARNTLVNLEELSDDELDQLKRQFKRIGDYYGNVPEQSREVSEIAEVKIEIKEETPDESDRDSIQ